MRQGAQQGALRRLILIGVQGVLRLLPRWLPTEGNRKAQPRLTY